MARRRFAVALLCLTVVATGVGCRDSRAIEAARARLDLARQTANLDEMYLSLRELSALRDATDKDHGELADVEAGIRLQGELAQHLASHDHEQVVQAAGALLDAFPSHAGARRAFKESGLIYRSLERALRTLGESFAEQDGVASLVEARDGEPDFERAVTLIADAVSNVQLARTLDPQFERAIAVDNLAVGIRESVLARLSLKVAVEAERDYNRINEIYRSLSKGLSYGSPQAYWRRVSKIVDQWEASYKDERIKREAHAKLLNRFGSTVPLATSTAELSLQVLRLLDSVVNPKGNVHDYRQDVMATRTQVDQVYQKVIQLLPDGGGIATTLDAQIRSLRGFALFKAPDVTVPILQRHAGIVES